MMPFNRKLFPSLLLTLFVTYSTFAQENRQSVYYLIVSNEHYSLDFDKFQEGFSGLLNLEEASTSADSMHKTFQTWGARKGIVLKSTAVKKLKSSDIEKSLNSLIQTIKKEKAVNPYVIFYYAGHGFSSKKLQALYLPNGDFVKSPDSLKMEDWENHATIALDLHEKLQHAKLPHLMLFDCCYSGRQETPERLERTVVRNFGLETMDKLMGETYSLLTAMFKMVGPDPVIFSTTAGEAVPTVPLPLNNGNLVYIAPLCRRILLLNREKSISPFKDIKQWMTSLLDKTFDPLTASAISYWVPDN